MSAYTDYPNSPASAAPAADYPNALVSYSAPTHTQVASSPEDEVSAYTDYPNSPASAPTHTQVASSPEDEVSPIVTALSNELARSAKSNNQNVIVNMNFKGMIINRITNIYGTAPGHPGAPYHKPPSEHYHEHYHEPYHKPPSEPPSEHYHEPPREHYRTPYHKPLREPRSEHGRQLAIEPPSEPPSEHYRTPYHKPSREPRQPPTKDCPRCTFSVDSTVQRCEVCYFEFKDSSNLDSKYKTEPSPNLGGKIGSKGRSEKTIKCRKCKSDNSPCAKFCQSCKSRLKIMCHLKHCHVNGGESHRRTHLCANVCKAKECSNIERKKHAFRKGCTGWIGCVKCGTADQALETCWKCNQTNPKFRRR